MAEATGGIKEPSSELRLHILQCDSVIFCCVPQYNRGMFKVRPSVRFEGNYSAILSVAYPKYHYGSPFTERRLVVSLIKEVEREVVLEPQALDSRRYRNGPVIYG